MSKQLTILLFITLLYGSLNSCKNNVKKVPEKFVKIISIYSSSPNGQYVLNYPIDINVRFESPIMMKKGKLKIYLNVNQYIIIDKFELTEIVKGIYIVKKGDMVDLLDVIKIEVLDGELLNANHQKIILLEGGVSLIENNKIMVDGHEPTIR